MRLVDCIQGSAQWLDARRGNITASRIVDVLDQLKKGGEGASRRNYRIELVAERLTGRSEDHYTSPEMVWGQEFEAAARSAYEIERGEMVDTVGFVLHPTFDFAGASPDGLIADDGGLEIKCPKTTTHLKWMLAGDVPAEHQPQMIWNMVCTKRAWWDFASYDPRSPDGLKLFTCRLEMDAERAALIEAAVKVFHEEVEQTTTELLKKVPLAPVRSKDVRSEYEQLMEVMDLAELVP